MVKRRKLKVRKKQRKPVSPLVKVLPDNLYAFNLLVNGIVHTETAGPSSNLGEWLDKPNRRVGDVFRWKWSWRIDCGEEIRDPAITNKAVTCINCLAERRDPL